MYKLNNVLVKKNHHFLGWIGTRRHVVGKTSRFNYTSDLSKKLSEISCLKEWHSGKYLQKARSTMKHHLIAIERQEAEQDHSLVPKRAKVSFKHILLRPQLADCITSTENAWTNSRIIRDGAKFKSFPKQMYRKAILVFKWYADCFGDLFPGPIDSGIRLCW